MAGRRIPIEQRFWPKVDKTGDGGCWNWTAFVGDGGYGFFARGGRPTAFVMAHRISFEMHNGPIPQGLYVCHRCDNRRCVNPDHLFLGTPAENVRDKNAKGRGNYSRHNAKLSDHEVADIMVRASNGERHSTIARSYGVSRFAIYAITVGKTYRHLTAA